MNEEWYEQMMRDRKPSPNAIIVRTRFIPTANEYDTEWVKKGIEKMKDYVSDDH